MIDHTVSFHYDEKCQVDLFLCLCLSGYYGSSSWEAALIDQVVGVVSDIWTPLVETVFMPDEAAQVRT